LALTNFLDPEYEQAVYDVVACAHAQEIADINWLLELGLRAGDLMPPKRRKVAVAPRRDEGG